MTDLAIIPTDVLADETEYVLTLIESCMVDLSGEGRSVWTSRDIDPVVDKLIELWQMFNIPNN